MFNQERTLPIGQSIATINSFFQKVYLWMTAGLGMTALTSFIVLASPAAQQFIFGNKLVFYGLIFAELGLVIAISAAINRISSVSATLMFLAYSALNGVTFAAIFLIYTRTSIVSTFLVTAGTFGAMSLYGYVTKRDMTGFGSFLFMSLIGIVIGSVLNFWLASPMIEWMVTYGGIVIFSGLAAYDHQKLKHYALSGGPESLAVLGALSLYLDFINLFLMLLRVMGNRR